MGNQKSIWAKLARLLALLIALAVILYWFWYLPAQQPAPALQIEFTP
ncbi:MAG: hypothetical protein N2554_07710 [Fimbriimonadales bacterium]|nr:hypothetical protein [Fimbriimonadales bacterium]